MISWTVTSDDAALLEAVRDYWDRRPCNVRHSRLPVGSKEFFDEVEKRKYFVEPHIPAFAEFAKWRGKRVLEVGCGIGTDTVNFIRAGAIVAAIDLSAESVKLAGQRICLDPGYRGRKASCHVGNVEDPPRSVNAFDLVYTFGVLHHTPNPHKAIANITRALKRGGELRAMVYNKWSYKVAVSYLDELARGHIGAAEAIRQHSEAQPGSPITRVYDAEEARELVESSGLKLERQWVDHIFPYRVEDYVQYRYRKHWWFKAMPDIVFRWLCHNFGWHRLIVARKV